MSIAVIAPVVDDAVLQKNLLRCPLLSRRETRLILPRGHPVAGAAYNVGIDTLPASFYLCTREDVYLPAGWLHRFLRAVAQIEAQDPNWALMGLHGVNAQGQRVGRCYLHGEGELGEPLSAPVPVGWLEDALLVVRGGSGLRFDEELPDFALFGLDLAEQARMSNQGVWVMDNPIVVNLLPQAAIHPEMPLAYHYLQRKWATRLPLHGPRLSVTREGEPLQHLLMEARRASGAAAAMDRHPDARALARQLGYETADNTD